MKYKTRKIPGSPEWMPEGVVCKVWDLSNSTEDVIYGYDSSDYCSFIGEKNRWTHAEPIPVWEPTPGEYCAFWDERDERTVGIGKYVKPYHCGHVIENMGTYGHVARITGVDCACSLEELKKRTDWL